MKLRIALVLAVLGLVVTLESLNATRSGQSNVFYWASILGMLISLVSLYICSTQVLSDTNLFVHLICLGNLFLNPIFLITVGQSISLSHFFISPKDWDWQAAEFASLIIWGISIYNTVKKGNGGKHGTEDRPIAH